MSVTLKIPMFQPRPRPKFKCIGKKVVAYHDDRNLAPVREALASQWAGESLSDKVALEAEFHVALPKRVSKARRAAMLAGEIVPPQAATKLRGLLRGVLDALNGVVVQEERNVVMMTGRMRYAETTGGTLRIGQARLFVPPCGEAPCAAS